MALRLQLELEAMDRHLQVTQAQSLIGSNHSPLVAGSRLMKTKDWKSSLSNNLLITKCKVLKYINNIKFRAENMKIIAAIQRMRLSNQGGLHLN